MVILLFCCSAYSLSKLAMMMFNAELGGRLMKAGSKVTANSLDPGSQRAPAFYVCGTNKLPQEPGQIPHHGTSPYLTMHTAGTVNTKMLDAGWGMCGIDIKVRARRVCTLRC